MWQTEVISPEISDGNKKKQQQNYSTVFDSRIKQEIRSAGSTFPPPAAHKHDW